MYIFKKIKSTFFTKEFLTFCIIGFVAYLTHQGVYLFYSSNFYDDTNHLISNGMGFVIASIVSYILNVKFTYKTESNNKTVVLSIITFILKFVLTLGITYGCMALIKIWFSNSNFWYRFFEILIPVFTTAVTLIFQFICFNLIFKKGDNYGISNEQSGSEQDTEQETE